MLPDFVVIGAMKAGTTSLFRYLRTHPGVFMPWRKELDFFSNDANWKRGLAWYEQQFDDAAPGQRIGEASPNYSKRHLWPETAARLTGALPGARIIYLVRDPIVRLQSMYLDMLSYGGESRSIGAAVASDPDYILTSSYGMQIEPYVERLGRDRVLVETSERLRADPAAVMGRVFGFLELDWEAAAAIDPIETNLSESKRIPTRLGRMVRRWRPEAVDTATPAPGPAARLLTRPSGYDAARLSSRARRRLRRRLAPDMRRLQELTDVDLSYWTGWDGQ